MMIQSKGSQQGSGNDGSRVSQVSLSLNEDEKLKTTENVWKPNRLESDAGRSEIEKETEKLLKNVRSILNKLTPQNSDKLMSKFKELPINSEPRLTQVINLIFYKAVDEPNFSQMYAQMCKLCSELEVNKEGSKTKDKINFRKLLITRCQGEFETDKMDTEKWQEEINSCSDPEEKKELQLAYEEKERAIQMKSVGNIRFIGELFKLGMLTPRIMHRCIEHLLSNLNEKSLESFCTLLTMGGKELEPGTNANKRGQQQGPLNMIQSKGSQQGSRNDGSRVLQILLSLNEDVKLKTTENAWKPKRLECDAGKSEIEKETEKLLKNVHSILNKLTPQNFDKLMSKFKELPINSEPRLTQVINIIFKKAVDEPIFSQVYAQMCKLCSKLEVNKEGNKTEDKIIFRKLLLTKCQREFETDKMEELDTVKWQEDINSCSDPEEKKELQLAYEEKERAIQMKSVGNVKFIGELFKLGMLTLEIMHRCINHLLSNLNEKSLECLCTLLTTVGKEMDLGRNAYQQVPSPVLLNNYFIQIEKLSHNKTNSPKVSWRVRFMLQDVIDLRQNKWVPRREDQNPKTIKQFNKEMEKETFDMSVALN